MWHVAGKSVDRFDRIIRMTDCTLLTTHSRGRSHMPQSKILDDGSEVFLCSCDSVGCGKIESISQKSLAEPPTLTQGAWITRALYYRHQKLDELLSDMISEADNAEAIGGVTIMRTLSRSSSMTSRSFVVPNDNREHPPAANYVPSDRTHLEDCNNAVDRSSDVGEITLHLEHAAEDLDHISTTINQRILSFSACRPLVFHSSPEPTSSSVPLHGHDSNTKPNTGLLHLKQGEPRNSAILTHEIHMTNALISLSFLSDVDVPDFMVTRAKVEHRVREEIQRVAEIKAAEWNRQLYYIQQGIPDPMSRHDDNTVDTGMPLPCRFRLVDDSR